MKSAYLIVGLLLLLSMTSVHAATTYSHEMPNGNTVTAVDIHDHGMVCRVGDQPVIVQELSYC